MSRARAAASALLAAAVLAGACSPSPQAPRSSPSPAPTPWVYVAIGASETVGIGTQEPVRDAFPQRFFLLLGPAAVLYNFGIPSETTAAALGAELPGALAVHPTLATVWLNVDDLLAAVPVAAYEARLDQLVRALTDAHVVVLLANTPQLDRLPAYAACRPNPPPGSIKCPLTGISLPPPDQVQEQVRAYNAAIAEVAARRGARLVDLAAAGQVPDQHPEYVSRDGFHPSAQGAAAIAEAFAETLGVIRPSPSPSPSASAR